MNDPTRNASNKKKALIAANIVLWLFQGAYTVSPIDLIPDVIPLIGWADDLLGLVLALVFTVYTIAVVRRHGAQVLLPGARPVLAIEEIDPPSSR